MHSDFYNVGGHVVGTPTAQLVGLEGGRRLRALVAGQGPSAVVLVSGLSAGASEWSAVQRLLTPAVRTVAYDRAGLGGSDPDSVPPTLTRVVSDLVGLLDGLGLGGRVVLVGHSWGVPALRLFARQHPERVAALCFVDGTVAEVMSARQARSQLRATSFTLPLAWTGLPGALIRSVLRGKLNGLSHEERQEFLREMSSASTVRTGARELRAIVDGDADALCDLQTAGLPDVPVTSIVGAQADRGGAALRPVMIRVHEAEMDRATQGRFVLAKDSGHMVPQQQPELVATEVQRLVDLVGAA